MVLATNISMFPGDFLPCAAMGASPGILGRPLWQRWTEPRTGCRREDVALVEAKVHLFGSPKNEKMGEIWGNWAKTLGKLGIEPVKIWIWATEKHWCYRSKWWFVVDLWRFTDQMIGQHVCITNKNLPIRSVAMRIWNQQWSHAATKNDGCQLMMCFCSLFCYKNYSTYRYIFGIYSRYTSTIQWAKKHSFMLMWSNFLINNLIENLPRMRVPQPHACSILL